jgi:hypothetical protein
MQGKRIGNGLLRGILKWVAMWRLGAFDWKGQLSTCEWIRHVIDLEGRGGVFRAQGLGEEQSCIGFPQEPRLE